MRQELNIWVVGGDLRQVKLAELLAEDGHTVHTYGLEQMLGEGMAGEESLRRVGQADCVVLPLPMTGEDGMLNAPLSEWRLPLTAVLDELRPEQVICAGRVTQEAAAWANARGLILRDYFAREELAVANAVPTAWAKGLPKKWKSHFFQSDAACRSAPTARFFQQANQP